MFRLALGLVIGAAVALYVRRQRNAIVGRLDRILESQQASAEREILMSDIVAKMKAALDEANVQTNNIAQDIANLSAKIAGGVSESDAAEVQAQLDALVTRLTGVAATTPDEADPADSGGAPPADPNAGSGDAGGPTDPGAGGGAAGGGQ